MERLEILFLKELYSIILILILISFGIVFFGYVNKYKKNTLIKYGLTYLFAAFIAFLLGTRDEIVGVDTKTYAYIYEYVFVPMKVFHTETDYLWDLFTFGLTRLTNDVTIQFIIVAYLYIFLPIFGFKRYLNGNVLFLLLFFLISPNFVLYGTNTIRNGLAASIFLFSFLYFGKAKQWIIIALSCLVHMSMIGPSFFFFSSKYFKNFKILLGIWLILLLFSFTGLSLFQFLPLSIDRLASYLKGGEGKEELVLNVPINFLLYSIAPILVASYFIIKKKVNDDLYLRMVITYLMGSCLYIIFFKASFAVRFAYLSEFLMPILMIYPFIKFKGLKFKELNLSIIILLFFLIKAYKIFSY